MEKNNKIKNLKKIKTMLAVLGTSAILGVTGCGKDDKVSSVNAIEANMDNTCFDETLAKYDSELISNITELESYIDLSNKLNKEKIEKMYITEEQLQEATLLSINEIEELLNQYKEGKNFFNQYTENDDKLLFQLNVQEKLVNNYIVKQGYRYSSEYGLWALKCSIADSYQLNTEMSVEIANSITIPKASDLNHDDREPDDNIDYIKVGNGEVKFNNAQANLLDSIYCAQKQLNNSGYNYNKNRNELISSLIEDANNVTEKTYKLVLK